MNMELRVWVDPKTREPSDTPIEMVFSNPNSFRKLMESGLRYERIEDTIPASQRNSYAGKCTVCDHLIRSELDLAYFPVKSTLDAHRKIAHRECIEVALLAEGLKTHE